MSEKFLSIGEIINKEPQLRGLKNLIKDNDVSAEFLKIFPDLKKIVEVIKTEKKVLFLRVEIPAWRNELKFKEKLIIEKINSSFNEERIKYIKYV